MNARNKPALTTPIQITSDLYDAAVFDPDTVELMSVPVRVVVVLYVSPSDDPIVLQASKHDEDVVPDSCRFYFRKSMFYFGDCLVDCKKLPTDPGLWLWEGAVTLTGATPGHAADGEYVPNGSHRRLTAAEAFKLAQGEYL